MNFRRLVLFLVIPPNLLLGFALADNRAGVYGNFGFYQNVPTSSGGFYDLVATFQKNDFDLYLGWQCKDDELNVIFQTIKNPPVPYRSVLTYNFDDNDTEYVFDYDMSTDKATIYLPIYSVDEFTETALKSHSISTSIGLAVNNFKGAEVYKFDLNGLEEAIKQLNCYSGDS